MALTKYKLGELVEVSEDRNSDRQFTINSVRGIATKKEFIETKADMDGVSLNNYKIVYPKFFAYVPDTSRRGDKISLAFNKTSNIYLVSSISIVFKVKNNHILLADYLFMYFNRPEFDRYSRFNSWGSARESFSWEEMCAIDIDLPSIEIQQKYVDIYNAMIANQKAYEKGLDDLKLVCFGYIENLRRKTKLKPIGLFVCSCNEKNTDGKIQVEQCINIDKQFITPQRANSNLYGRRIVRNGQFAYCTQLNNENVAIALRKDCDCVVSSVYEVFEIIKKDELLDEYLMLWLIRPEFGRFVYWAAVGSAYEFLDYNDIINYLIPVPDVKIQQSIVDIYNQYITRKEINEKLKAQIKDLCPILIKGSLEEGIR